VVPSRATSGASPCLGPGRRSRLRKGRQNLLYRVLGRATDLGRRLDPFRRISRAHFCSPGDAPAVNVGAWATEADEGRAPQGCGLEVPASGKGSEHRDSPPRGWEEQWGGRHPLKSLDGARFCYVGPTIGTLAWWGTAGALIAASEHLEGGRMSVKLPAGRRGLVKGALAPRRLDDVRPEERTLIHSSRALTRRKRDGAGPCAPHSVFNVSSLGGRSNFIGPRRSNKWARRPCLPKRRRGGRKSRGVDACPGRTNRTAVRTGRFIAQNSCSGSPH